MVAMWRSVAGWPSGRTSDEQIVLSALDDVEKKLRRARDVYENAHGLALSFGHGDYQRRLNQQMYGVKLAVTNALRYLDHARVVLHTRGRE